MSGYLRDSALRRQLEEKVKEATRLRQSAEEGLKAAQDIVEGARRIDANVLEADKVLAEATAAIGAKDYRLAADKAAEAAERGKRLYRERIQAMIDSSAALVALAKGVGADVAEAEAALGKARDAAATDALESAVDLAKRSWKRSEKVLSEHLSSSFSKVQALILSGKNLGRDTAAVEDLLSRARTAMEGHNFESALEFTREGLETITEDLSSALAKEIRDAEDLVRTAQELGADVTKATTFLERARADVTSLEFEKANNAARQSRAESEKALARGLEGKVSDFSKFLAEARSLGAGTAAAEAAFGGAEAALKSENIREGARLAKEGFQALQEAQFQQVVQTIAASRDKFVAAVNLGLDLNQPMGYLGNARVALQKSAYREALAWVAKANAEVDASVGEVRKIQERLKDLHRSFAEMEPLGVDTKPARRAAERAREAYQNRDLAGVHRELDAAKEELRKSEREQIMRSIEDAEFLMAVGREDRADLSGPSKLLEEAIEATKVDEHEKALGLVSQARSGAEALLRKHSSDRLASLRDAVPLVGDDGPSLKAVLNRAEASLGARDYEGASKALDEGQALVSARTKDQAAGIAESLGLAVQMEVDLGVPPGPEEALAREASAALEAGRHADVLAVREKASIVLGPVSENLLNLVKARIAQAQGLKVDVEEMSEYYRRARMALGVQDYAQGLRLLKEGSDRASKATAMARTAHDALSSAAAVIAEARKRNVDVSKVIETLVEGKKALERMDYARAMELAAQARAETEKLSAIYTSAQKILISKERMELAAKLGIDAPHLRDLASEAKEAMKLKDYERAVRLASKCDDEFSALIRDRVSSALKEAEGLARSMEGVDLATANEAIVRARKALEAGDFASAADLARVARTEFEKLKRQGEEADGGLRRVRELLADAEAMNLETPGTASLLDKAERSYKTGRFEEAMDLAAQAEAELVAERDRGVAATMRRFEESVERARREGTDTRSAEQLLERSREFFRAKKYRQALATALQSEAEVERVALQQAMASQAVATVDRKLNGVGRAAPAVDRAAEDARAALSKGDYVKALDAAIKASDALADFRAAVDEAQEVRVRAQALRQTAREVGVDASRLDSFIRDGDSALEAGDAAAAEAAYAQTLQWGLDALRALLDERIAQAEALVETCKRLEVDPTPFQNRLAEVRGLMEAENFAAAAGKVRAAQDEARQALGARMNRTFQDAADNVAHAKKLGTDARSAEELLRKAQEQAARGEYEAALGVVGRAVEQVESVKVVEKRFVDLTFKAESTIRNGKRFGIDMRAAEKRLADAMETRRRDLPDAIKIAEESYRLAWEAVEAFAPNLKGSLEVAPAKLNEPVDATITVENAGKGLAKDVKVRILGDAEAEGLKELPALRAHGKESLSFKLKMTAPGSVPLAIQIVSHRVFDDKEYVQEMIAQVEVAETPQERPKKLVAGLESRCPICKGAIKKGFRVTQCVCGRDFHDLCATRVGRCPVCFRPLGGAAE